MAEQQTQNNPTHDIFHVIGNGEASRWTKIGVGWQHKDGEGINLVLNYMPQVPGRTVVRTIKQRQHVGAQS